jgi:hypothetical protein
MTTEELRNMFQENTKRSAEAPPELQEVINAVNNMAYKLCGTMLVNCGDSPELTTAIDRIHEGSLCFQDALSKVVPVEATAQ